MWRHGTAHKYTTLCTVSQFHHCLVSVDSQWIVEIADIIMVKKKFRAIYVAGWHEWNVVPFVLSMCLSRCLAYLQALSMLHDDHIMVN